MPEDMESDDAKLIMAYAEETKIPAPLEKWYRAFENDRRYVNTTCMALDAEDAVATNHILRNQYTIMAMLNSRDAGIRIGIDDAVWPDVPVMAVDPMTGMPLLDPMTGMPIPTGQTHPGGPPPELEKFTHTQEVLAKKLLRETRFRQQLAGAIQDIETSAVMFAKVNQQEDFHRDPLGNFRFDDQQDNFALYRHWAAKVAEGEIEPDTAEFVRFKQLESTVREYLTTMLQQDMAANPLPDVPVVDPMSGMPAFDAMGTPMMQPQEDPRMAQVTALGAGEPVDLSLVPEVPRYVGFPIDFIHPEDIRFSWEITRMEDFFRSPRVQVRVVMTRDKAAAKFNLTPEEAKKLPDASTIQNTVQTTGESDPSSRDGDLDEKSMDKKVELWECYDRETNKVNVYAKGFPRFLSSITPRVVWRNWIPIIPLMFNRVSGRAIGISSTTLQRPAQEEINTARTMDRHAKKACFPRILVRRGVFARGEASKYKRAMPYEVIELETPDELSNAIKETQPLPYNPALTDTSRAQFDLQRMSGTSLVAGGAVGVSSSATETATAQQGMDALIDYRRGLIEDFYQDIVTCLLDLATAVLPEENVKALCGPGAVWPQLEREAMWRQMHVKIEVGSTGRPETDKHLGWMTTMTQIARNLGMVAQGPEVLDFLSKNTGIYENISKYFQVAPAAPMGGGMPPNTGGPPPSTPKIDSKQGEGGGGGEPMSKAPSPESIPNRPQI